MGSKTILMLNDGTSVAAGANVVFSSRSSLAIDSQGGIYDTLPNILAGDTTTVIGSPVPCSGYKQAHLMPVSSVRAATNNQQTVRVYLFYAEGESGGDTGRFLCHELVAFTITNGNDADSGTAGDQAFLSMPSRGGTAYRTSAISGISTASLSTVNNAMTLGVVSGATLSVAGSDKAIAAINLSLMGADYVACAVGAPGAGAGGFNAYLRLY